MAAAPDKKMKVEEEGRDTGEEESEEESKEGKKRIISFTHHVLRT